MVNIIQRKLLIFGKEWAGKNLKYALPNFKNKTMILRIWKGTTTHDNENSYVQLLKEIVFPHIERMNVAGYKGIQLLKNPKGKETEFITIMAFEDLKAVKGFAGEDYEQSYVIDEAKALLKSYDSKASELLQDSIVIP